MRQLIKIVSTTIIIISFTSCEMANFTKDVDLKFADQSFKTAIANIELYKIRHGFYPSSMDSLEFLGDWDMKTYNLYYERLDTGYRLDINIPMVKNNFNYPKEFWSGLGITKSNILENK